MGTEWKKLASFLMILSAVFTVESKWAGRVHNGEDASEGQFPHQVHLEVSSETALHACGGSLISQQLVLSAAHCFRRRPRRVEAWVGSTRRRAGERIPASHLFSHPDYSEGDHSNDIAVLRLARPATLSDRVKPIRLPPREAAQGAGYYATQDGGRMVISGWGQTRNGRLPTRLQYAKVSLLTRDECRKSFGYRLPIPSSQLCSSTAPCPGDSGGPLAYFPVHEEPYLVGLPSFGPPDCTTSKAEVYTNVAYYLDWLSKIPTY